MEFSGLYLINRLIFRFSEFFRHWYRDGIILIANWAMGSFEAADRSIAFRITLKHFFEPLYGDYSVIGRLFGIVFRSGRIIIGSLIYVFMALVWTVLALIWILIPVGIVVFIYHSFNAQP